MSYYISGNYMSGSGTSTNPRNVLWFCHRCLRSFTLPSGCYHRCSR